MAKQSPDFGKLITDGETGRDAVHVAVAPVTANTKLEPGEHVGFVRNDSVELVGPSDEAIGIVDPFLVNAVEQGERFWLFLYLNSITGLRHVWKHPAFQAVARNVSQRISRG